MTATTQGTATRPPLPPVERAAFLLDFDGTLVDIAPAPELVRVAEGLPDTLRRLRTLCGDALAVVTGRPIAQIDQFLPGVPYAVAGEHGIALRRSPEAELARVPVPPVPSEWLDAAEALVAAHPGARVERKATGFVLHYRAAPQAADALREAADRMADESGGAFHVQTAKMAWEIRPHGTDKGSAVHALMQQEPFLGRLPVFIGDDVTDEDGIRAAIELGGTGYRIPADFDEPESVRRWLTALAAGEERAWAV